MANSNEIGSNYTDPLAGLDFSKKKENTDPLAGLDFSKNKNTESTSSSNNKLKTNVNTSLETKVLKTEINSKFIGGKISSDFLDLGDLDSLTSEELIDKINDTKIYLDINSPKEWDKWIDENKGKLPEGFKKQLKEYFPEIYTDIDASILGEFDINKSIKIKAKEIYNQKKGPYIIDFNNLSDDLIFDMPITYTGFKDFLSSVSTKSFGINPDEGIIKYDSKEEALKDLYILQKSVQDASYDINEVMKEYKDGFIGVISELGDSLDNQELSNIGGILFTQILPTIMYVGLIGSFYRGINRTLIRWGAGSDSWFSKQINKITLGEYNNFDPSKTPSAISGKEAELQNEIITRRKFQLQYEYISGKDASDLFAKYGRVNEAMLEQTFYRKLGNRVVNRSYIKRFIDTLSPLLVRNFKDSKVEKELGKLIPIKNSVLQSIFTDTKFANVEDGNNKFFQKIEVLTNSDIQGDIKDIYNKLSLSHLLDNKKENDIKIVMDIFIKKLKTGENIDVRGIKKSEDAIKKIENNLLKEINKVKGVKITSKFLEDTKKLNDAKTMFNTLMGSSKSIDDMIEDKFANSDSSTKVNIKSFFTEILSDGGNRYNEKTAIHIINEILNGKGKDAAIKEVFEKSWDDIDKVKIDSNSFEASLKDLNKSYKLTKKGIPDIQSTPTPTAEEIKAEAFDDFKNRINNPNLDINELKIINGEYSSNTVIDNTQKAELKDFINVKEIILIESKLQTFINSNNINGKSILELESIKTNYNNILNNSDNWVNGLRISEINNSLRFDLSIDSEITKLQPIVTPNPTQNNGPSRVPDTIEGKIDNMTVAELNKKYTKFSNMLKSLEIELILKGDIGKLTEVQDESDRMNSNDFKTYLKDLYNSPDYKGDNNFVKHFKEKYEISIIRDYKSLVSELNTKLSNSKNSKLTGINDIPGLLIKIKDVTLDPNVKTSIIESIKRFRFKDIDPTKFKIK